MMPVDYNDRTEAEIRIAGALKLFEAGRVSAVGAAELAIVSLDTFLQRAIEFRESARRLVLTFGEVSE